MFLMFGCFSASDRRFSTFFSSAAVKRDIIIHYKSPKGQFFLIIMAFLIEQADLFVHKVTFKRKKSTN